MTYRVSLLGPLLTQDVTGEFVEPPTGQHRQVLIALAIRPGHERPVPYLQEIIWGHNGRTPSISPIISKLRAWAPMPSQARGINTYKTLLRRNEVDATDFIDRVADPDHLTVEEADELLGMWRGDPAILYDFLPESEFNALVRARADLIGILSTWSRPELGRLSNLESFRALFEEQCASLQVSQRSNAKRLLIVDDDVRLTEMLADLLRDFQCVTCHSLGDAMEMVTDPSVLFHGALVDLHLTKHLDSQGLEVLDALREHRPDIPRVLLTSSPMADGMLSISDQYGLYEILVKNGNDAPTRTRRTVARMLSDTLESNLLRAHATLDTLASRVMQTLQRNAVAARRNMRLNPSGPDELDSAVEKMEQAGVSIDNARSSLRDCRTAESAAAVLAEFQDKWAGTLDHGVRS